MHDGTTRETPPQVSIFHDESGDFGHGEWAFVGMLWVRQEDVPALARELAALREPGAGEVHFYRFPRGFGGEYGATARSAQAWFELWRGVWLRRVWFSALAVQRRHPRYDGQRFRRPESAYQHFSGVCLAAGLEAFFAAVPTIALQVCSDERMGSAVLGAAHGGSGNALATVLGEAAAQAAGAFQVTPPIPVRTLSCTPVGNGFSDEQELLQLTDLLLGAVSTAILPRGVAATKLWFARQMARLMEQVRQPADESMPGVHGHLLVSYYPDPIGRVYRDGPIGIWDL